MVKKEELKVRAREIAEAESRLEGVVTIKSEAEIETLRQVCQLAARTLKMIERYIRIGITTAELDLICHDYILSHGAYPSPLYYKGFPKSICTSVNEVVCHGIPSSYPLKEGDIVNIDITVFLKGFHGDLNKTYFIGSPSAPAQKIVQVAEECLRKGIAAAKPEMRLGDIGYAIQSWAESQGCSVVRDFTGHGIGRGFHERPTVLHFGQPGRGYRLRKGMTFTIEPMINLGGYEVKVLKDDWTVVTVDGSLSAQFEHTICITETGCEILTLLPEG